MANPRRPSRHQARRLALQALYQQKLTSDTVPVLLKQFEEDLRKQHADQGYFENLVEQVIVLKEQIDQHLSEVIECPLEQVSTIELIVMRMAVYEFIGQPEVPYKVVINEALQLSKRFGSREGFKFINWVLDRLSSQLRVDEINPNTA